MHNPLDFIKGSVYVAATYAHHDTLAREMGLFFMESGLSVTSNWIISSRPRNTQNDVEALERYLLKMSQRDYHDVCRSQFLVLRSDNDTDVVNTTGGKHSELGMFMVLMDIQPERHIFVVGGLEKNIFQRNPMVKHVETCQKALEQIQAILNEQHGLVLEPTAGQYV